MKKTSLSILLIVALGLAMLPACGGGSSSTPQPAPYKPTTAVLTLLTSGVSPTIGGIEVTVVLPDGVTAKSTTAPSQTGAGVVTASGGATGALISGVYTAATGTLPGTVKVYMISSGGLAAGEFCKVNSDISAGHYPTASSFAAPTLDDATGIDSGLSTVILTGQLSLSATAVVQ